jgi:hypothetical protein
MRWSGGGFGVSSSLFRVVGLRFFFYLKIDTFILYRRTTEVQAVRTPQITPSCLFDNGREVQKRVIFGTEGRVIFCTFQKLNVW